MDIQNLKSPNEIKDLSIEELEKLANDIRTFLVESVSETGGHLGSNLGVVELTIALHYMFDSPKDKIIFDVGHQAYVHKILTGRANQFKTLRQYDGLSGFLKIKESPHDVWEAGHSSTSISAAAGFAYARDLNKTDEEIVALIGDGCMTNGMVVEALNHITDLGTKVIVIINDNEMSISSNIGFIDRLLKDLQSANGYYNTKDRVHSILSHIPFGKSIDNAIYKVKNKIKNEISSTQNFFNLMGYRYYGPIDGHDYKELIKTINLAKATSDSVIIHVKTTKGKGYLPAEINKWHGIGKFNIEDGSLKSPKVGNSYSKVISTGVEQLMDIDENIVVITPAMEAGSELSNISQKFPNRFTDVGIAEGHAVTFAGALALYGKKPFISIYSTFLQRSYDQVFHDLVRQETPVVIGVDRAGLVGEDGETHQGIYDISFLSHMPDIEIVMGKDAKETKGLLKYAFQTKGVCAIRYPRGGTFSDEETKEDVEMIYPTWTISKEASKYIVTYGPDVDKFIDLTKGLDIGVVNARSIKPLDFNVLEKIIESKLYIVEEHCQTGGLGSMICDAFINRNVDITLINLGDKFILQGNVDILKKTNEIDPEVVIKNILG